MSITFNADEIFEMAIEIELNGAKFYREAAGNATDAEIKKMLIEMALMEDGHVVTFTKMREDLGEQEKEQTVYDPNNEAAMYLQTMADSHGIEGKKSVTEKLTGQESTREILEIALNAEKDSVVFYFGLRGYVSAQAGKDRVEAVIVEEISHITRLNQELAALDG
jgi:rubrerythrin